MKRTCLISSALALLTLAPSVASAEPGILYVPTEDITLYPTNMAPCGASVNSALGCYGVSEETVEPPYADADNLTTALANNLVEYDVMVTNVRPPEYISYVMHLASDDPADMSTSFSCAFGGINCEARNRNAITSTSGTTMNCIDPEVVHASTYAFGRVSGLEGVDNPEDWMNYVVDVGPLAGPDYAMAPLGFQDVCNDRVQQQGFNDRGMQVSLPLECTSVDHFTCDGPGGMQGQNSHQDLLMYYGARVEDTEAPVLSNIVPEDGAVLMAGDDLVLDVDISDGDPIVGVRWTVTSEVFIDIIGSDTVTQCTNDVCDANWMDASPLKATDSDWEVTFAGLPPGEYAITLEAADYHGNIADMVSATVTIMGEDSGTSGPMTTGADSSGGNATNDDSSVFTTGEDESGDGTSTSSQDDTGGGGCSCRTTPAPGGAMLMLLGLMGLGTLRRRRLF
ncbi:MYXO-CTERM sorting domain-containing protein [Paraliomyxa miuraensis]|uniref:MYXO-CTERM sorting domain-containing protein n=1 Tax=Paraliomyxa miuraensis TaxID=376150 RepID=UPI00224E7A89|nr:MYXO-CTERM sorting domain-containing protein [Paraliomyxa miuraensis]MCX4242104.1 DUF4625 domain-containing protein [Paraliomyxa miuraensis]